MATLELYLIRHGVAAERGEEFPDDSKRPLTSEGIARLRKEAKALEGLGVSFDQILSSPLVRARQTADVFAEELKGKPPIANTDALTPAGSPGGRHSGTRQAHAQGAHRTRRPRAQHGRAGGVPHRRQGAAALQEGRDLPDRFFGVPTQGQGRTLLVRDAQDAPQDRLARSLTHSRWYAAPGGTPAR